MSQIQDGAPLRTSERWCGEAHCPMCSDCDTANKPGCCPVPRLIFYRITEESSSRLVMVGMYIFLIREMVVQKYFHSCIPSCSLATHFLCQQIHYKILINSQLTIIITVSWDRVWCPENVCNKKTHTFVNVS